MCLHNNLFCGISSATTHHYHLNIVRERERERFYILRFLAFNCNLLSNSTWRWLQPSHNIDNRSINGGNLSCCAKSLCVGFPNDSLTSWSRCRDMAKKTTQHFALRTDNYRTKATFHLNLAILPLSFKRQNDYSYVSTFFCACPRDTYDNCLKT
jgi:hypothetical protein